MVKKIIFALLLIITSPVNSASNINGGKLYELCNSKNPYELGACDGYILAVLDAMHAGHLGKLFKVCTPNGVSVTQFRLVTIKHLASVPDKLQYLADGLVAQALGTTFPCKTDTK